MGISSSRYRGIVEAEMRIVYLVSVSVVPERIEPKFLSSKNSSKICEKSLKSSKIFFKKIDEKRQ